MRQESVDRQADADLRAAFMAVADGVSIVDHSGALVFINESACGMLDLPAGPRRNQALADLWCRLRREDGTLLPPEAAPSLMALRTGQPRREVVVGVELADGQCRWLLVNAIPVFRADGGVSHIATTYTDISERKRAAAQATAQAAAMAQVSLSLASALEPVQLYAVILEQCSRVLPYDHAAVLLYQDGWATVAGSRGVVSLPIGTRVFRVDDLASVAYKGRWGKPALIPDTAELANWIAVEPFVGPYWIRSVLVVPLVVDGTFVGTFNVDSFSPSFYTEQHLNVVMAFAEQATQALRNARLYEAEQHRARAAEELARMRSDFVAAVSHELRTPLTAIVGYAEVLQAYWTRLSDSERLERLGRIIFSANRQQRLVEDLLLISQIEITGLIPHCSSVPLLPLLGQAILEVQGSYPGQSVSLLDSTEHLLFADPPRVLQILVNLLDNAAKYSTEGTEIAVLWQVEDDQIVLQVRDQGQGVPVEGREHLFTRFGRVPTSRTRAGRVGTGLGLYLGRQLARAMGGELDLAASGPGGSTFRLRLPLATAASVP